MLSQIGYNTFEELSYGIDRIAIGNNAGYHQIGNTNIFIGTQSFYDNSTTGTISNVNNIGLGHYSGKTNKGSNNIFIGNNVDDSAHAFGIVSRTRIGNYFHILDAIGRHAFEHLRRIIGNHIRWFSVQVNAEIRRTFQLNVIFAVNRYQRHFTKQIKHVGCG